MLRNSDSSILRPRKVIYAFVVACIVMGGAVAIEQFVPSRQKDYSPASVGIRLIPLPNDLGVLTGYLLRKFAEPRV